MGNFLDEDSSFMMRIERTALISYTSRCSSVVEHFLGKEEVVSSILINGSSLVGSGYKGASKKVNRGLKDEMCDATGDDKYYFCCLNK